MRNIHAKSNIKGRRVVLLSFCVLSLFPVVGCNNTFFQTNTYYSYSDVVSFLNSNYNHKHKKYFFFDSSKAIDCKRYFVVEGKDECKKHAIYTCKNNKQHYLSILSFHFYEKCYLPISYYAVKENREISDDDPLCYCYITFFDHKKIYDSEFFWEEIPNDSKSTPERQDYPFDEYESVFVLKNNETIIAEIEFHGNLSSDSEHYDALTTNIINEKFKETLNNITASIRIDW